MQFQATNKGKEIMKFKINLESQTIVIVFDGSSGVETLVDF